MGGFTRVKVVEESVDTGFRKARELLAKVDKFPDCREGIVVCALHGGLGTEHVAEDGYVTDLLLSHELDEVSVFSIEASGSEICFREHSQAMVEQVKLNPLLVQRERLHRSVSAIVMNGYLRKWNRTYQRLIIEITPNIIHRLCAIRPQSAGRHIRHWHRFSQLTITRVSESGWIGRFGRYCLS